jgi:succinate dehydrogenase / fumarate reductase, cytochrome b subunit
MNLPTSSPRAASAPGVFATTVAKKAVLALTGAVLFLFVLFHLLGNLILFGGREAFNHYAKLLRALPEALWAARAVLPVAVILHILCAVQVTITNWTARPVGYAERREVETNYAARTMIISGPLLLLYVVYHLMMFTFLTTGPGYSRTDVYGNVIAAFQVRTISAVYVVAMLMLGFHLYHGIWSALHTLGVSNPRYQRLRRILAPVAACLITAGYIAIPIAVLIGAIR